MTDLGTVAERRLPAIDAIKAAAIIAVVLQHSRLPAPPAVSFLPLDLLLHARWLAFHVPAFLLVSGFLYHRPQPIEIRVVARRLQRVLTPYLIASVLALSLTSRARLAGPVDHLHALATGGALGIYYYVFIFVLCLPLILLLSRLGPRPIFALLAALLVYAVAARIAPGTLSLHGGRYWAMRNPFNFFYVYFLTGWLTAHYLPQIRAVAKTHAAWLRGAAVLMLLVFTVASRPDAPDWSVSSARVGYSIAVVGLLSLSLADLRTPRWILFLSRATLPIYLYHQIFSRLAWPLLRGLPPLELALANVAVGLGGAVLLCLCAEALLGRRARTLLGLG